MTAVASHFTVRVMVPDVWDHVALSVEAGTTVEALKRQALERVRARPGLDPDDYVVKFRGAAVLDEGLTLGALGARANSPFIVLLRRRQPVR